jgi:hypothetical protein
VEVLAMKRVFLAAALVLAIGAGWISAALAPGDAAKKSPATVETPTPAPIKAIPATPPPPPEMEAIKPPPPMTAPEIPPIPEVGKDPFTAGPAPVRKPKTDVLEEGKRLFNREGRMELDAVGHPVFVFDSGDKPMRILENSWRQHMEGVTERGTKRVHWRISGEVTVYEDANYLLLRKAVRLVPEDEGL